MGLGCRKEKHVKLPPESEFKDQTPRMLRKGNETLGNTLVTFTNKNNNSLQAFPSNKRSDRSRSHNRTVTDLSNLRINNSEYPELQFSIHEFLHDPRGTEINILRNGADPTVRTYRTRISPYRHKSVRLSNDNQIKIRAYRHAWDDMGIKIGHSGPRHGPNASTWADSTPRHGGDSNQWRCSTQGKARGRRELPDPSGGMTGGGWKNHRHRHQFMPFLDRSRLSKSNEFFHDMIGHSLEVYIDDVVIKSPEEGDHVSNMKRAFLMRQHKLKMNPKKCVFGVQEGNFLGSLVHQSGIEIDKNKTKSIIEALPPRNKKESQSLLGKINLLRRFISNSAEKIQPFSSLLRLKLKQTFKWEEQHQQAFEEIKYYLSNPLVLSPPKRGRPLKLYVSASEVSIGSLLVQDNKEWMEHAVYFLSRTLTEVERKYYAIERLCLALYFTAMKLRHYMLPFTIYIIAKTDLIKYMLTRPMLRGRIGKWTLALIEFAFRYVPQKAVKGQVVADFLADHPWEEIENMDSFDIANADLLTKSHTCLNNPIYLVHLTPWKLYFDGSKTDVAFGAGLFWKIHWGSDIVILSS
ncbi:hypothetical protein L3X38_024953 [Prunus dulcis]|uniref:Reverse transcriptase/retrotransposon-derived protein RNase H-like domain-containing protein n=1 Tax=Prunus dulcis TaxID=3755 RepID=A0AAD4W0U8_PRUDU|nr:hypothetical protein L3X38_024953 [Prunus dulcis]